MTTANLARRLEHIEGTGATLPPVVQCISPKDDMTPAEMDAWEAEERAKHPPDTLLILRQIITPEGWRARGGA